MKQVSEMPTSGQFVAVWQKEDIVISECFDWLTDGLFAIHMRRTLTDEQIDYFKSNFTQTYFIAD